MPPSCSETTHPGVEEYYPSVTPRKNYVFAVNYEIVRLPLRFVFWKSNLLSSLFSSFLVHCSQWWINLPFLTRRNAVEVRWTESQRKLFPSKRRSHEWKIKRTPVTYLYPITANRKTKCLRRIEWKRRKTARYNTGRLRRSLCTKTNNVSRCKVPLRFESQRERNRNEECPWHELGFATICNWSHPSAETVRFFSIFSIASPWLRDDRLVCMFPVMHPTVHHARRGHRLLALRTVIRPLFGSRRSGPNGKTRYRR